MEKHQKKNQGIQRNWWHDERKQTLNQVLIEMDGEELKELFDKYAEKENPTPES